jgi:hypothetical protein
LGKLNVYDYACHRELFITDSEILYGRKREYVMLDILTTHRIVVNRVTRKWKLKNSRKGITLAFRGPRKIED